MQEYPQCPHCPFPVRSTQEPPQQMRQPPPLEHPAPQTMSSALVPMHAPDERLSKVVHALPSSQRHQL